MKSFRKQNLLPKSKKIKKAVKSEVKREVKKDVKKLVKKPTALGQGLRTIGGAIGGLYGLSNAGHQFGGAISRIFGQGDYVMSGCNNDVDNGPPSFAGLNAGVRVTHREYVTDISSSVSFASQTFFLNPGLVQTFPWLSTVAKNFEEYEIKGMVVYLKTNSANAVSSTNTALGMWGVVTQYDATDLDFTTKQQCENYAGTTTAVPSKSVLHAIECKKNANVLSKLYVRSGALLTDQDQKFYDMGKFQIFTQGAQAASVIGEMWISYDIMFTKPRLPTGGLDAYTDRYYLASGPTNSQPLGTLTTLGTGSIGSTFRGSTNDILIPGYAPEGFYHIILRYASGSSAAVVAPVVTYGGSVSAQNYWNAGASATMTAGANLSSTSFEYNIVIRKAGTSQGFVNIGGAGTLPPTPTLNAQITLIDAESVPLLVQINSSKRLDMDELKELREILREFKIKKEENTHIIMDIEDDLPPPPKLIRQNANIGFDYDIVNTSGSSLRKLRQLM